MVSAIIAAAGKGIRMQNTLRKQYIEIAGFPILCHTLKAIDACSSVNEIILVVPKEEIDYARYNIISRINLSKKINLVAGGAERRDSVYNGILAVKDVDSLVLIHDGVRPFIRPEQIDACISAAKDSGESILGVPVHDTIKNVNNSGIIYIFYSIMNRNAQNTFPRIFRCGYAGINLFRTNKRADSVMNKN